MNLFRSGTLFCFCFLSLSGISQIRENLDITHYKIHLTLQNLEGYLEADANIYFEVRKKTKEISFDLHSLNEQGKGMEISSLETEDPIAWKHADNQIKIGNIKGFEPDRTYTLNIKYKGEPADGLIISKNKHGNATAFGDNWPNRAHHWFPSNDHPSDKATVEFIVDAPQQAVVVANGQLLMDSIISKILKRSHWKTNVLLPTKVMVVGIANFSVSKPCTTHGVEVTSWVFEEQEENGFNDYAPACNILGWFIDKVGPYPYEKLANVQSKTRYGGMENASCIFYFEESVNGKGEVDALLAHEIAHQWFGNSASEKDWPHLWLSEGFATYLTDLYIRETEGEEAFKNRMMGERDKVLKFYKIYQAPVVDTLADNPLKILNPSSYQKAAWVLYMLHNDLGDALFWKCLKSYYEQYKFSNANTQDFIRVIEKTSGREYSAFFRQWLRTTGHPQLEVVWEQTSKKTITITVTQQQNALFDVELEVLLKGKKVDELKEIRINKRKTVIELPCEAKTKELVLDPNTRMFFEGNVIKE